MTLLLVAAAIALMALIVVLYFRPYDYGVRAGQIARPAPHGSEQDDDEDETRWRSVRIRPGLIACPRAGELQSRVFASRDAPPLPLGGCDEQDCRCHYLFADDRRSGLDRRAELDRLGRLLGGKRDDRRRGPGRRAGDLLPA